MTTDRIRPPARPGPLAPLTQLALLLCTVALSVPPAASAQPPPPAAAGSLARPLAEPGAQLRIQLVTFGAGAQVHQYFGHDALLVEDRRSGRRSLYNYGMFSFGPGMLANFLQGRLTFWVAEMPAGRTFHFYREARRTILVQDLDLVPAARLRIARKLAHDVQPEHRDYLYHHYRDNCTTRLRDIIDDAVDGQLGKALDVPSEFTHRGHTRRYAQHDPLIDVGLQFMMNDQMEQPITRWQQAFLPEELAHAIEGLEYDAPDGSRRRLVSRSRIVYQGDMPEAPARPYRQWPWTLLIGFGVGGIALLLGAWLARLTRLSSGVGRLRGVRALFGLWHVVIGLAFGIPGLLGGLTWAFTEHDVTYRNENMWLANPLTFLLWLLGIGIAFGSRRAQRGAMWVSFALCASSLLGVALKLLPAFNQENFVLVTLLLPTNLGLAWAHHLWRRAEAPPVSTPNPPSPA